VNVLLRGPEGVLRKIDSLSLEMNVDLRDADPGERSVLLTDESLEGLPAGAEVARIEPDRFTVTLARRLRKTVPVVPSFVGSPPPGYSFYWGEASPDALQVEGPEDRVTDLERVRTDPIHLDGRTEPFLARVGAVPDSPQVRILDPRTLEVRAMIDVSPVERRFDDVPVVLAGAGESLTATPPTVDVVLAGPPLVLDRVPAGTLRALADVRGLRSLQGPADVVVRVDFVGVSLDDLSRLTVRSLRPGKIRVSPAAAGGAR
jgi:YbbR domain-containing protein